MAARQSFPYRIPPYLSSVYVLSSCFTHSLVIIITFVLSLTLLFHPHSSSLPATNLPVTLCLTVEAVASFLWLMVKQD